MLTPKEVDSENKTFSKIRIIFVNTAASWVLSREKIESPGQNKRTKKQRQKDTEELT
jgi:hypothetical protein